MVTASKPIAATWPITSALGSIAVRYIGGRPADASIARAAAIAARAPSTPSSFMKYVLSKIEKYARPSTRR